MNVINQATEYLYIVSNPTPTKARKQIIQVKWVPPGHGSFKLNTDGVVKDNPGDGCLWGVIRNHKGDWIIGLISKEANTTPFLVELNALRQGLAMASSNNLVPLEINLDSQEVVTMFHEETALYKKLIYECGSLMEKLNAAPPIHVYREQNRVANLISKEGLKRG
ncbi:hypothetical protein KY285_036227 [Solanum tuberosum]|nr:hypothetical protein KY285_036227 [Solanum tuberosum]